MNSATRQTAAAIEWRELEAAVPMTKVRPPSGDEAIEGVMPSRVVEALSTDDVARVLDWATRAGAVVVPRGGGTKMTWGNLPAAADLVLSTRRMDQVLEHPWQDMTVTVQAGCTISTLQRKLAEHGQRFALDALWPDEATVGGVLATNDNGALRVRFGGLRDLIIGATVVLPDGTIAKSGGKVVKNVAGYDLQKLMTGALGTLGVITEAIFRTYPVSKQTRTLTFHAPDVPFANELLLRVLDSTLVPTGVQIRSDAEANTWFDIRFEGIAPGVDAQVEKLHTMTDLSAADAQDDVWQARENLWSGERAPICKISVLPAEMAEVAALVRTAAPGAHFVLQSTGIVTARLDGASLDQVLHLRAAVEKLGGSLVVLECPTEWKSNLDVWGSGGDALPLMIKVKQQFDPAGTLNRGRFIGRI
jgi:glycolate oxidase FAD binding subunit